MKTLQRIGLAAATLVVTAGMAFTQDVVLRYSSWLPPNHHVNVNAMYPWFAEIEKVTDGRVRVEVLPKVVGTAASQFDVIRDGLADISFIVAGYTPGRFPLAEMGEMSWVGNDARLFAPIFNDVYNEYMLKAGEFEGVKLMTIFSNSPGNIATVDKPVRSMADLKGLKLRSTGPWTTSVLNAVGAIPILKSSNEAFEMMSTGVIDGSLGQRETVKNMNMMDLIHHYTIIPGGLFSAGLAVIMNEDAWNRISPADQAAIEAISNDKLAAAMGKSFHDADAAAEAEMRARPGIEISVADDAFLADLHKVTDQLEQEWAVRARAKGVADPLAVLAEFHARVAAAEAAAAKSN